MEQYLQPCDSPSATDCYIEAKEPGVGNSMVLLGDSIWVIRDQSGPISWVKVVDGQPSWAFSTPAEPAPAPVAPSAPAPVPAPAPAPAPAPEPPAAAPSPTAPATEAPAPTPEATEVLPDLIATEVTETEEAFVLSVAKIPHEPTEAQLPVTGGDELISSILIASGFLVAGLVMWITDKVKNGRD